MSGLKDLLEGTLEEIDRQMKANPTFTPEQALIWIFGAESARGALTRLYGKPKDHDGLVPDPADRP